MKRAGTGVREKGFLVIAGVFLLVVLAGLVAYLSTVSTTSQAASAADLNSSRAYQAARAGVEWAAFHILRDPGGGTFKSGCEAGSSSVNLTLGSTLSGFVVKVDCSSTSFTEGAASPRTYSVLATACNDSACPSATTAATYVERQLSLTITR
jgi:MSHA biogenesis protein MshP